MKNLDQSLSTSTLDESFNNAVGDTADSKGKVDWNSVILASIPVVTAAVTAGTQPRGEEEVACGRPQPTWNSARLDTHNKCVENFRASKQGIGTYQDNGTYTGLNEDTSGTNWLLIGGITLAVVGLGIGAYFVFRKKAPVVNPA